MGSPLLEKPLDFPESFGIMCVTTRKEREMTDLKPYYQVKLTLLRCKLTFSTIPRKPITRNTPMTLSKKRIG